MCSVGGTDEKDRERDMNTKGKNGSCSFLFSLGKRREKQRKLYGQEKTQAKSEEKPNVWNDPQLALEKEHIYRHTQRIPFIINNIFLARSRSTILDR